MSDLVQTIDEEGTLPAAISIPRISIHAFCDLPETAKILQGAASDRRLSRAHTNVQTGGIAGAVKYFDDTPTPNLLIVESRAGRDQVLDDLARLSKVCDSGTKVVVIGHVNDVLLYRQLIQDGVSEYVVAPFTQLQIIESIASLYNAPGSSPLGRVTAFVGASGGAGSSTLSHNIGWAMAKIAGRNTVIVDLDIPFGTAGLNFNQDPPQGVAEALSAPDRIDDTLLDRLLTRCTEQLSLLAAPGLIDRDVAIDEEGVERLLDVVRRNVPNIVVDVPHVWGPWARKVLVGADDIVITATPDLASLRNGKNLFDFLKSARANDSEPKLVINQVGVPKKPEIGPKEFAAALETEPVLILPYDPQLFGTAANNGQMIDEVNAKNRTADGIVFLARMLAGTGEPAARQSRSLLSPILSRFSRGKGEKADAGSRGAA